MLTSKELRVKAWNSLKGKYWRAFLVVLVLGLLASGGISLQTSSQTLTDALNLVDPSEMDAEMELGAAVVGTIAAVMAAVGMAISLFVGNAAETAAHYRDSQNQGKDKADKADAGNNRIANAFIHVNIAELPVLKTSS